MTNRNYPNTLPALNTLRPLAVSKDVTLVEVPATNIEDFKTDLAQRAKQPDLGMDAIFLMADTFNHSPTGWEVIRTFSLRVQNDGDWVRVEIEDNGPGMDEKTRRSIFEPFFTTKPAGRGTGLGLSVSYFIITEDHDGEMEVHAAANGGTRFVIRLPKAGKANR